MILLWAALLGYSIGSIPSGLLLAKGLNLGDLRKIGSGSIGATNVLRTGHKGAAAATLLLDGAKAAIAVILVRTFFNESAAMLAGLFALIGHCYPIWLGFRGGKAVASYIGMLLAFSIGLAAIFSLVWLISARLGKISSLSALIASALAPFIALLIGEAQLAPLCFAAGLLIFWRHKDNIHRLLKGTEPRIGSS